VQIRVVLHSNATANISARQYPHLGDSQPRHASPRWRAGDTTQFTTGPAALAPHRGDYGDSANLTPPRHHRATTSSEDILAATPSGVILASDIVYLLVPGTLRSRNAPLATYQASSAA
jgi:hypothetical protein